MSPQRIGLALQTAARRRQNGLVWARIGSALASYYPHHNARTYGCHVVCSAHVPHRT